MSQEKINILKNLAIELNDIALNRQELLDQLWEIDREASVKREELTHITDELEREYKSKNDKTTKIIILDLIEQAKDKDLPLTWLRKEIKTL